MTRHRILCVRLMNWPIQRLVAERPELRGRAIVLHRATSRGRRVVACSAEARRHGVRISMPAAEASALLAGGPAASERASPAGKQTQTGKQGPASKQTQTGKQSQASKPGWAGTELAGERGSAVRGRRVAARGGARRMAVCAAPLLAEHDPAADRRALEKLAAWCGQFSPAVGLDTSAQPDSLLIDIASTAALFGGEALLVELVAEALARRGLAVQWAAAATVGAAWAEAHEGNLAAPGTTAQRTAAQGTTAQRTAAQGTTAQRTAAQGTTAQRTTAQGAAAEPCVAARHEVAVLRCQRLPVAALRLDEPTCAHLAALGIERIEQLMALPRAGLAARFGPGLLLRIDQLTGAVAEPIEPHSPPPEFEARRALEHPAGRREALEHVLDDVLAELCGLLRPAQRGVLALRVRLDCRPSEPVEWTVGLFSPTASAAHLSELARMRLERIRLASPVWEVDAAVVASAALEVRQLELFDRQDGEPRRDASRKLAVLIDRLASRVGAKHIVRPRLVADAQPERAFFYQPLGDARPERTSFYQPLGDASSAARRSVDPPLDASLTLLARPLRLRRARPLSVVSVVPEGPPIRFCLGREKHRVARSIGPERIETGWWRGELIRRDYYRVETTTGAWFWIYRQVRDGRWFLHAEFE